MLRAIVLAGDRRVELGRALTVVAGLTTEERASVWAALLERGGEAGVHLEIDDEAGRDHLAVGDRLVALGSDVVLVPAAGTRAATGASDGASRTLDREELRDRREELMARRSAVLAERAGLPDDAARVAVHEALEQVRLAAADPGKPSAAAAALADQWVALLDEMARLPAPKQPPEWLLQPALAALQEARAAVARAEAAQASPVEPSQVDALERAHRRVLEAEQRTMQKSNRLNRRRLEQAQAAERAALRSIGVASYGEYLQLVAPGPGGTSDPDARLAEAKSALADAEAVWDELHGGSASPEWTACKERQAALRAEARALLGREVDDDELAGLLRDHHEGGGDVAGASARLRDALAAVGAEAGDDAAVVAETWLAAAGERSSARASLEADLRALDDELAVVREQLRALEHRADEAWRTGVQEARHERGASSGAAGDGATNGAPGAGSGVASEAYVLVRLAAALAGRPAPVVVDAAALARLPGAGAARVIDLLERASAATQVVVLGEDGEVALWAQRSQGRVERRVIA